MNEILPCNFGGKFVFGVIFWNLKEGKQIQYLKSVSCIVGKRRPHASGGLLVCLLRARSAGVNP